MADNAHQVASAGAQTMLRVAHQVRRGNERLNDIVTSMNEIRAASEKIARIIKVIDEISFQTNILALNAARAGEAGMGFAVVADEVRNLSQRSAQAAKDAAALIEESITITGGGSKTLGEATEVFRSITKEYDRCENSAG